MTTTDLDAAIVDFNRAIQLNPKDAVAYSNRGNTKRDKGDVDGAIVDYNRAIRLDSKYAIPYYSLALPKSRRTIWTEGLPTTIIRSSSIRNMPLPTSTAATPRVTRAT